MKETQDKTAKTPGPKTEAVKPQDTKIQIRRLEKLETTYVRNCTG